MLLDFSIDGCSYSPKVESSAWVAADAKVIGQVEISEQASVFFGCIIRGDILPIKIGPRTNIQELSVLHTTRKRSPLVIGVGVTVGHRAVLHGCRVEDNCLIGMGAIVLDDAVIGEGSIIGAGAVVTEGAIIPPGSLVVGVPGKVIRNHGVTAIPQIVDNANSYIEKSQFYKLCGL